MATEIRPVSMEEFVTFQRTNALAFGRIPTDSELTEEAPVFEPERSLATFVDGQMVATTGIFTLTMTVPEARTVPVAGVSWVGVLPTHRRQGILTVLMRQQLSDVRERGEPFAALLASESTIYGRYGYGVATRLVDETIERAHATLRPQPPSAGRVRLLSHDEAQAPIRAIYEATRLRHPGEMSRNDAYWAVYLRNPTQPQRGAGPRIYAIYEERGRPLGYVWYRVTSRWENELPRNLLHVEELVGATPAAEHALWSFCLRMDLMDQIQIAHRPVEDPLRWMLADSRRLQLTAISDRLWLRFVDVVAAFESRSYPTRDRLVFDLHDPFLEENSGTYQLEAGDGAATCSRVSASADLSLSVDTLGSLFLGGFRWQTLARAGLIVEHTPGALNRADALFAASAPAWCATGF